MASRSHATDSSGWDRSGVPMHRENWATGDSTPIGVDPIVCLSDRIRRARRLAGVSQAGLASRLGVGSSAVAQWELAHGTTPTVDHLAGIACCCAVRFEWLATGRGELRDPAPDKQSVDVLVLAETDAEGTLLLAFRRMSEARRMALLRLLQQE